MKSSILYLSYDGLTDPLGQSQVLPYIIGLSQKGYRFTIISFEKQEKFEKLKDEINKVCQQHSIKWIPLRYHKKPPVLSTLFDIWKLWQNVKQEYKTNSFQIIHCRSYISSLAGLKTKQKWNVKFIFDMRGFWADERVEGGLWNLKNPLYKMVYRFFKKKEKQFLVEADQVVSLTHNAKKEIESWNIKNAPITVIPTCVDLDLFEPKNIREEDQNQLRLKLGIQENDFVLLYLGSWGTWYLTQEMFDFFSALKKEKTNAKFLIVTTDQIDLTHYLYKDNVIVTAAARKEVPLYISLAQVSICFVKPTFSKKASSATKMGEIMAMNVPVVVNEGWGDVAYFANKAEVILKDNFFDSHLESLSKKHVTRIFCESSLSLSISIQRYNQIYNSI